MEPGGSGVEPGVQPTEAPTWSLPRRTSGGLMGRGGQGGARSEVRGQGGMGQRAEVRLPGGFRG